METEIVYFSLVNLTVELLLTNEMIFSLETE